MNYVCSFYFIYRMHNNTKSFTWNEMKWNVKNISSFLSHWHEVGAVCYLQMMPHYLYEFEVEPAHEIDESDKLTPEKLRKKNTEGNSENVIFKWISISSRFSFQENEKFAKFRINIQLIAQQHFFFYTSLHFFHELEAEIVKVFKQIFDFLSIFLFGFEWPLSP